MFLLAFALWLAGVLVVALVLLRPTSWRSRPVYVIRDKNFRPNLSVSMYPGHMIAEWMDYDVEEHDQADVVTDMFIGFPGKVAWLIEPESVFPRMYRQLRQRKHPYEVVLTHQRDSGIPRAKWVPNAMSHVPSTMWKEHRKTHHICAFISGKNVTEGHKRRRKIPDHIDGRKVDKYGMGVNNYVQDKGEVLSKYRYCIVIENSRKSGYFSEKLLDCFLTFTIPLMYWGDPDIDLVFDTEGILDRPRELTPRIRLAMQNNYETAAKMVNEKVVFETLAQLKLT